ncbi:MAG TPA: transketolase [Clostridiales bacterium]|nr:transketolase [Clostridiales bacterium]
MNADEIKNLQDKCREIRYLTIEAIGAVGVGHLGGSMSIVEALVVLYHRHMNVDPANPKMEGRDRLVLSKGHAGPALYSVLADKGFFDKELLLTLNQPGTMLPSHADMNRTPGVDMTTGSLGQGFSCSVGVALGSKLRKDGATVYTIIGDGESQEGLIWEAAMFAAHKKLENLVAFTDLNKMQIDGAVKDVNDVEPLPEKWRAFGWNVYEVDGHDIEAVDSAISLAGHRNGKPTMIILDTVKGKDVTFLEEQWEYNHNIPISAEQTAGALAELKGE